MDEVKFDPIEIEKQHTERMIIEAQMREEDRNYVLVPRDQLLQMQDRVARLEAILNYTQGCKFSPDKKVILAIGGYVVEEVDE